MEDIILDNIGLILIVLVYGVMFVLKHFSKDGDADADDNSGESPSPIASPRRDSAESSESERIQKEREDSVRLMRERVLRERRSLLEDELFKPDRSIEEYGNIGRTPNGYLNGEDDVEIENGRENRSDENFDAARAMVEDMKRAARDRDEPEKPALDEAYNIVGAQEGDSNPYAMETPNSQAGAEAANLSEAQNKGEDLSSMLETMIKKISESERAACGAMKNIEHAYDIEADSKPSEKILVPAFDAQVANNIKDMLSNKNSLKYAFVISEILNEPISLRRNNVFTSNY